MLIPFAPPRRAKNGACAPASHPLCNTSTEWEDGTYLVGVMDGNVVGAVPIVNEIFVVDLTDVKEVLTMVRDRMPAEVREAVKRELLNEAAVALVSTEQFSATEVSA